VLEPEEVVDGAVDDDVSAAVVLAEAGSPPDSLDPPLDPDPPLEPPSALDAAAPSPPRPFDDDVLARRSFLAQPEPLKWIVGGVNAFLIGPLPQTGHVDGGSAWTPWTTSNRVPQAAQS
jgi:hypothetical protein